MLLKATAPVFVVCSCAAATGDALLPTRVWQVALQKTVACSVAYPIQIKLKEGDEFAIWIHDRDQGLDLIAKIRRYKSVTVSGLTFMNGREITAYDLMKEQGVHRDMWLLEGGVMVCFGMRILRHTAAVVRALEVKPLSAAITYMNSWRDQNGILHMLRPITDNNWRRSADVLVDQQEAIAERLKRGELGLLSTVEPSLIVKGVPNCKDVRILSNIQEQKQESVTQVCLLTEGMSSQVVSIILKGTELSCMLSVRASCKFLRDIPMEEYLVQMFENTFSMSMRQKLFLEKFCACPMKWPLEAMTVIMRAEGVDIDWQNWQKGVSVQMIDFRYCGCWRGSCPTNNEERTRSTSPLHACTVAGNHQVIEVLLRARVDPDCRHDIGTTPLMIAAQKGDHDIMNMLLDSDANVNLETMGGVTALWLAVFEGQSKAVELLVGAGSVILDRRIDGLNVIQTANKYGRGWIVQYLEKKTNSHRDWCAARYHYIWLPCVCYFRTTCAGLQPRIFSFV